jgi:hypothetical protein
MGIGLLFLRVATSLSQRMMSAGPVRPIIQTPINPLAGWSKALNAKKKRLARGLSL